MAVEAEVFTAVASSGGGWGGGGFRGGWRGGGWGGRPGWGYGGGWRRAGWGPGWGWGGPAYGWGGGCWNCGWGYDPGWGIAAATIPFVAAAAAAPVYVDNGANCWVRRRVWDGSGRYLGRRVVNLCM